MKCGAGFSCGIAAVVAFGSVAAAEGAGEFSAEQLDFFESRIRPVLAEHCFECHSAERQRNDLRLDSRAAILRGGDSGQPAVAPGDPEASRLVRGIRYNDVNFQMPPRYRLDDEDVAALERWVAMGAPWPDEPAPAEVTGGEAAFEVRMERLIETHWSLRPVERPDPPRVDDEDWVRSPIDRFVLRRLEDAGLAPSPRADRRTLIRRAYFDLIGLPPTYEEVEAFVRDDSPDAWERVIERLLASPHYGERWGRHWLDVARYGDTRGYIPGGAARRYAYSYTYRDYVINAFNEDKPFNEFIVEQLAADKLMDTEADDREALAAMGFLTVGRRFQNNIHDLTDDRIDVTTRGFMGLSVSCARCHDHMYDPIPTADYYSLYGVFRSSDEPEQDDLPLVREPEPTPEYEEFQAGLAEIVDRMNTWREERRVEIEHELRGRIADYLVYQSRVLAGESPAMQGERGALNRGAVRAWGRYLEGRGDDPLWRLWHELAELEAEGFAEAARELIERDRDGGEAVNGVVLGALRDDPPATMQDAAKTYGTAIEGIYERWREKTEDVPNEERPAGLEDEAAEQVRAFLYAGGSPVSIGNVDGFLDQAQRDRLNQFRGEMQSYTADAPGAPARAMVMFDRDDLFDPFVFRRGQAGNRGDNVPRRFLQALEHVDGGEVYESGSGRLRMARAIASDANPLTPRVAVNRVWQHHFGHGIVRTPSDFGTRGERPTHPDLLDWLASEFMARGWSIKAMHRLIMNSAAYQQASDDRPDAARQDPENRLLWKINRRRLEFEPTRDSVLAAAGRLDRTVGGRSAPIHEHAPRRAVYAFLDRENLPGLYMSFDVANPDVTTAIRPNTTVPQQALFMMNSPFLIEQARALADRAAAEAGGDAVADRIVAMYRLAFARDPSAEELSLGASFVESEGDRVERPAPRWLFAYGRYDSERQQVARFDHLPHFTGEAWQGGPDFPDGRLAWARLTAQGGHTGRDNDHAVIRRLIVPATGEVAIDGVLRHPAEEGDGVLGWIVSEHGGELAHWHAHHGEAQTHVPSVSVRAGEAIDFIVAPGPTDSHDGFEWAPVVRYTAVDRGYDGVSAETQLHSEREFIASSEASDHTGLTMDVWSQYAQVLLLSNEFAFVD